ncbi:hypothetical protein SDC9_60047 [bioreactor metagenome]|uniref:DUF306 domain-containing protein n=1 Tax=bioreactor metagenome TaxID=1076179 RepID=A0A644XD43_9ZZZZ
MMRCHIALWLMGTAWLAGGCAMLLEEPEPTRIDEIVAEHKLKINRDEELNQLCGKAWVPVYIKGQEGIDGKNAIELPPEIQSHIEFHRDGTVSGFAGVNRFTGSFAVTAPNLLRFGALQTTLMAGQHLDYEMLFMAQVNEVSNFEFKDGMLELKKRNMLMLRCKPVDLAQVQKQSAAETATPVPPEPASKIAPRNGSGPAAANPALPTVENVSGGAAATAGPAAK